MQPKHIIGLLVALIILMAGFIGVEQFNAWKTALVNTTGQAAAKYGYQVGQTDAQNVIISALAKDHGFMVNDGKELIQVGIAGVKPLPTSKP